MRRVVVVGGGIAGLATAVHLEDGAASVPGGVEVVVLEAGRRVGGNIWTEHVDGFTIERGPNGYLDNVPAMARLVERLDLGSELQAADKRASKRFLYRHGRLHQLPTGLIDFLRSPVLTLPGRLRVCLEPFARSKAEGIDETIHEFAERRIGAEAAQVLIDAMVSGVFAGDTRRLSLASAFPKMAEMEEAHGSLVRAMASRMRLRRAAKRRARELSEQGQDVEELTRPGGPAGPGGTLTSFRSGLETLVTALAGQLGGAIRYGDPVAAIEALPAGRSGAASGPSPRWAVSTDSGITTEADAVVIALPAPAAAPLLTQLDRALGEAVGGIATAPVVVVALAYAAAEIGGAPDGFGFLVPRCEGLRSLGCLWDSSIFPGRAPAGSVLLRVMIGGAHDPEAGELDDDTLVSIVRRDLAQSMGLMAEPSFARVYRHPVGIAQYDPGHQARLDMIDRHLRELSGLWVSGSSFHGVSMNACVEMAERRATVILEGLSGSSGS